MGNSVVHAQTRRRPPGSAIASRFGFFMKIRSPATFDFCDRISPKATVDFQNLFGREGPFADSCIAAKCLVIRSPRRRAEAMSTESPLERRLPWVHAVLEISEILPRRFRRLATGSRRVDRGFYQLNSGREETWAISRLRLLAADIRGNPSYNCFVSTMWVAAAEGTCSVTR